MSALHLNPPAPAIAPEDEARAGFYGLIANLLATPPHPLLLGSLGGAEPLEVDEAIPEARELAHAWNVLRAAARSSDTAQVAEEWHALFTSTGRPAVVLQGSWYLTGFLMEKPLAAIRDDLAALGLARRDNCGESEDHLAALCDVMRALVMDDRRSTADSLAAQKQFFDRHIRPWCGACCNALASAPEAVFFSAVGRFAGAFLVLEGRALDIES